MTPDPRAWLVDTLLPWWAERAFGGTDGGFLAELTPTGQPVPEPMRLCLVQSRLLYSFSHAALLGAGSWALEAAGRADAILDARFRGTDGGWVHAAAPEAAGPRREEIDFYDQAFVLFALAWWYRASGDTTARRRALDGLAALDALLADPAGGWREATDGRLPRRQNPHMHLLEAMHAWADATGEAIWLDRAETIVGLFLDRFFEPETGTLREFLDAGLRPEPTDAGLVREPGHHMEWIWLLLHHRRLTGDDRVLGPAEALWRTALAHGIDRTGHVVDVFRPDGRVLNPGRLLWPQTEAVKAALARAEFLGSDPAEADAFLAVLWRDHVPEGGPLWINRLSEHGRPISPTMPTRLLYHLTLCCAEFARLRPGVRTSAAAHDQPRSDTP